MDDAELLGLIREWVEIEGYTPRRKHMRFLLQQIADLKAEINNKDNALLNYPTLVEHLENEIKKLKHPNCTCWKCSGLKENPYPQDS